jgi:hypothetical protein
MWAASASADVGESENFALLLRVRLHFTVCTTDPELPVMLEVPLYVAVTVVVPFGNAEVVTFAFPPLIVAVPSVVEPAMNLTVPVTLTVGLVTVAVNFTNWP